LYELKRIERIRTDYNENELHELERIARIGGKGVGFERIFDEFETGAGNVKFSAPVFFGKDYTDWNGLHGCE